MNWRTVPRNDPQAAEIRSLREDLYFALELLADSLPAQIREVLRSYRDVVSLDESRGWLYYIAEAIVPFAQVVPRGPYDLVDRAPCPLCGGLPQSFGDTQGFAVPTGLAAHLRGHGNAQQCEFTRLFLAAAHRDWAERFGGPGGSVARDQYERQMETRRGEEVQFQVNPYRSARLIDEGCYAGLVRKPPGMTWAEARLKAMGFKKTVDRKVVSFIKEYPRAVVYADPRKEGGLDFVIAAKPLDLNKPRWSIWSRPVKTYFVPDRWKNDLVKKLDDAVDAAVLPAPPVPTAQILKFPGASLVDEPESGL